MTDTEAGNDMDNSRRSRDTLCKMIGSSQMFADFPSLHIEIIAHYATIVSVTSGETVFREGEKGQQMYLVAEGSIEILKDSGGSAKSLTIVKQGQTMGEMSIFDELPYSASAVAAEDCQLVCITHANFNEMAQEHPKLGINILRCIARLMSLRLRHTTGTLVNYID